MPYTVAMPESSEQFSDLRHYLITSQQQPLNISRSLLAAQKVHARAVEASLRLNRRLLVAMAVLLVIVGGLNLYALWPSEWSAKRVIIIEEPVRQEEPPPPGIDGTAL